MTGPDRGVDEWSACESALGDANADIDPALGSKLALLQKLHQLAEKSDRAPTAPPGDANKICQHTLGRFQIRRELGRGSFGVVYLAFDPRLDRDIALKVPHPEVLMTPQLRRRFHQEAQVAAALDHPNVVAVHEVGEEGAFCFLVSTYCPGGNLADWLQRRHEPVSVAVAANLVQSLALAVHHAHDRGIIHRDLKPANVMLTGIDRADDELVRTVRITDFGLAKLIDGEGAGTRTNAAVGTPLYMAPEQTLGRSANVGPPVDIYALGIILFELLTGRTPFSGESTLEILYQVRNHEPISPRRIRPDVPIDLETICLKCLEKNPSRRYATAQALADDLARYLSGHPVNARPIGPLGRAGRWAQRRPAIVVLLVGLFLSLVGGSIGIFTQWRRAEQQSDATNQQQVRADANLKRAHDAADRMARLANDLADKPGLNKTRQELLESTLAQFEELLAEQSDDPRIQLETAMALRRAAVLRNVLGQHEAAQKALLRGIGLFDTLLTAAPNDPALRVERIGCNREMGLSLKAVQRNVEAKELFKSSVAQSEMLFRDYPDNMKHRQLLTECLIALADQQRLIFEFEYAENTLARIRELERTAPANAQNKPSWQKILALAAECECNSHWHRKRLAEAESCIMKALTIRERLIETNPNVASNRFQLAVSIGQLSSLRRVNRDIPGAIEHQLRSQRAYEQLMRDDPDVPLYRVHYAQSFTNLGVLHTMWNSLADAEAAHRKALALTQQLLDDFPDDKSQRVFMHVRHFGLGECLLAREQFGTAIEQYRKAPSFDDSAMVRERLAWVFATSPDPQFRDSTEAQRIAQDLVNKYPSTGAYRMVLGAAKLFSGDHRGAQEDFENADKLQPPPINSYLQAIAWKRLGDLDRARRVFEQVNQRFAATLAENPEYQRIARQADAELKHASSFDGPR